MSIYAQEGLIRNQNEVARRYWSPLIDVHESEKEFVVNADLPGIPKEQINVDVHDNTLVILVKINRTKIQRRKHSIFKSVVLAPSLVSISFTTKR
ncbi:unnamed protein product [Rhizophagus irregularis]|nr:unnamed protein product [Rhizophagus irregularis]